MTTTPHPARPGPETDFLAGIATVDDAVVCTPAGDLHMDNEPQLHAALNRALAHDPAVLVVDLSKTTMFTSSALNALLRARRDADRHGVPLVLAAPAKPVRQVLRITEADRVFRLYPTVQHALASRDPNWPAGDRHDDA
ncbi:STAS domain-containing protein [Kitasatospora sp. NPDC097605]|uniref:STAS domain-containing protein n=1 Tax=Kitasatospora sp. NPDC097605 TaxID=3157226 RepID=UPI00332D4A0C